MPLDDGNVVIHLLSALANRTSQTLHKIPVEDNHLPVLTLAIAAIILTPLLLSLLTPSVDPKEPPLLKPRVPLIGHILGLFRHQADYHHVLTRKNPNTPIATLQMLTGKMYVIWDPVLVSSGLRNKHLDVGPHIKAVTPLLAQTSPETTALLRSPEKGDYLVDRIMAHAIPPAFKGDQLAAMTSTALSQISTFMDSLSPSGDQKIPNTWLFLRHLLTLATSPAIYGGHHDPFTLNPSLEQTLWDMASDLLVLSTGRFLPSLIARKGLRARDDMFASLGLYYRAKRDAEGATSGFVRNRAKECRDVGVGDDDIARIEALLPFAAMTNTVPTLFWFFSLVVSDGGLVSRLRGEVERGLVVKREEEDEVTVLVGLGVEEKCPLLWACYKETLRVSVHQVSTRTVMEDTVVNDGEGRGYLLKKDCVVQMSLGVSHSSGEYWGEDVKEFRPDRWLEVAGKKDGQPGSSKLQRAAYQPFGGGVHLCPGRHFAVAEMMAVVATLILGFEIEPLEGGEWKLPGYAQASLIDAVTKPVGEGKGFGVRIKRRVGWEKVNWKYVV